MRGPDEGCRLPYGVCRRGPDYRSPEASVCNGEAPAVSCRRAGCAHGDRGEQGIFLIFRDHGEWESVHFRPARRGFARQPAPPYRFLPVLTSPRGRTYITSVVNRGDSSIGALIRGAVEKGISYPLRPNNGGIRMPFGKDVFQNACIYMIRETEQILNKNSISLNQLKYFIPHQANARITDFVANKLILEPSRVLTNIEQFGNTGSASTPIVLSQNMGKYKQGDIIVLSVFGGGYSSGAVLLKKL